jgi:serine protease AprX
VSSTSARGAKSDPATWPALSAPGAGITSACRAHFGACDAAGSNPEHGPGSTDLATYWTGSGTSWAAPHVAGFIALLLQVRPAATPAQLDAVLKKKACRYRDGAPYRRTGGSFSSYDKGAGLVDAYAAALAFGADHR